MIARRLGLLSLLALSALLHATSAAAFRAPEPGTLLPDYDARLDPAQRAAALLALHAGTRKPAQLVAGAIAEPGATRLAALAALERASGDAMSVRWSGVTGSPQMIFARQGLLSAQDSRAPELIARGFIVEHRDLWLLSEADARSLETSSVIPLSGGGSMVTFHQEIAGLEVLHGHLGVGIAKDGRVSHVAGGDVTGAGALVSRGPRHVPVEAIAALMEVAGLSSPQPPIAKETIRDGQRFVVPGSRDAFVDVRLVVTPTAHGPHLAWLTNVSLAGSPASYEVAVDDESLLALRRFSRTFFLDTRGKVFANNPDVSPHVIERFVDDSDYRFDESPLGWSTGDMTEGNNTTVRDDLANDDDVTLGAQAQATPPGPYLAFDFPFTGNPAADLNASLTNLFRDINVSHDHFYRLGFDERSGNFQVDNLGRGGLGSDPVIGDCQDGGGTDNANFATQPDGAPGRMQMYLWATGTKDGSLDMGVVMHEFVHGVSTRLVGGPADASCLFGLQGGAMGEGWSDYFAASYLNDPVMGAYVGGDPDVGIRMFALDDNPPTGKDYRNFCNYNAGIPDCPPLFCEPHANGEIWSGFLWLIREQCVTRYGNPEGARLADQLVVDALKLTPCAPSMLDARDAVILADRLSTGGVHECIIKTAAANRWMGFSARPNGGTNNRPVAANDQWPECLTLGAIRFTREDLETGISVGQYGCEDIAQIEVTDGNVGASTSVTVVASSGDSEVITLNASTEPAVLLGMITLSATASAPNDGVLTVVDSDSLTATYADADAPGPVLTTATVNCTARIALEHYFIRNGSCDVDEVPGYPALPGFVDRGESADLQLEIRNLMPIGVSGAFTVTTDRPDLLTILPALTPFDVSLPAAVGQSPATTLLTVKIVGSATIDPLSVGQDAANLFINATIPGYLPAPVITLPLLLGRDYLLEPGAPFSEDMESESAPVGPRFTTGTLNAGPNQWSVITCNAATGNKAYKNGESDCTGTYNDTQGDPWLATPAYTFWVPSVTAEARITRVSFSHDVDLGAAGIPMFGIPPLFDAEAVVLLASNDPSAVDLTEPFALLDTALAVYANATILGLDSNTTGYVPQVIDVSPLQTSDVDFSQPTYLVWYFITDFTPSQCPTLPFPLSAVGEGYNLDDLVTEWERVQIVPATSTCVAPTTVYSFPRIVSPTPAAGCAGAAVEVSAASSESYLCGPPADLEYRFLVGGVPVPCFVDATLTVGRTQDVDGWGASDTCFDGPLADAKYDVEVRCAADPSAIDSRSVTMRIVDGLAVINGAGLAFCAGSGQTLLVDGSSSSLVGCPGVPEYRYTDAAGAPLDCDGDTLPDDFRTESTCIVGPSDVDLSVSLELRCSTLPSCTLSGSLTIPAISVTANAAPLVAPPGGVYCEGSPATLTAVGSVVTGCAGGALQYRWTDPTTFDTGWTTNPEADYTPLADVTLSLEVRCNLNINCTSTDTIDLVTRKGTFSYGSTATPDDCPGTIITVAGTPRNVTCTAPAVVEMRFLFDADRAAGPGLPVTIACIARTQDVDGWGSATTCDTAQVVVGGDYIIEMRCSEDPTCVIETGFRSIQPRSGTPVGTSFGPLYVRKTAAGCTLGSDVSLTWPTSDYLPSTYVTVRSQEPSFGGSITGYPAPTTATTDITAWTDVGAACDGGGAYRGPGGTSLPVNVYFYQYHLRDGCTNQPLPDP